MASSFGRRACRLNVPFPNRHNPLLHPRGIARRGTPTYKDSVMKTTPLSILLSCAGLTLWFGMFPGLAGCGSNGEEPHGARSASGQAASSRGGKTMTLLITSAAFTQGHPIPKKYTGEGVDVSPPLSWSGLPEGTKELALICDDPDAPTPEPWVHWVIYKISADVKGLPEGVPRKFAAEGAARRAARQELLARQRCDRLPRAAAAARPRRTSLLLQALRAGRLLDRGAGFGQEGRLGEDQRSRVG